MDKPRRLLIVDDEPMIRNLLLATLAPKYHCTASSTVCDALTLMKTAPFDVIITDVLLPDCSGLAICLYVKEAGYDVPVIVMSGQNIENLADLAAGKGAFGFLPKPFTIAQIYRYVARAFKSRITRSEAC